MLAGVAWAPLTCGELVQGTRNGRDFLISCPLSLYSRAEVWLEPGEPAGAVAIRLRRAGPPPGSEGKKAILALKAALRLLGQPVKRAEVVLTCPAPAGKGLGTSTADILATAQATAVALGRLLSPRQLAALALAIEPSDSTMFPGLALFDHRRGLSVRILGMPPPLDIVVLDLGGQVDTEEFNRHPDLAAANRRKEPRAKEALRLVRQGIERGDPRLVGRGATLSALAHQEILPKPGLEDLVARGEEMGALGVVNAHSGTVVGVLVSPGSPARSRLRELLAGWPGGTLLGEYHVTGGGIRVCPTEDRSGQLPVNWE